MKAKTQHYRMYMDKVRWQRKCRTLAEKMCEVRIVTPQQVECVSWA